MMGKKLGQHFLTSPTVLERILAEASLSPGEAVLEPGPGRGVLTERLLDAGARVTAVEVDPGLCGALRERWSGHPSFRLVEGDILKVELSPRALFDRDQPYAVIANLPYYLSTPFFFRMIAHRGCFSRMVLMVQKEIAERLVALPEQGKAYGALSIAAHHAFEMRLLFRVPPGAFRPPPKVDSAVVAFAPRPPLLPPEVEVRFLEHVKQVFTTRRKLMLSALRRRFPGLEARQAAALDALVGKRRAEALSPEAHLEVFRVVEAEPPAGAGSG
jgi:16S rRNA (adenine1518-N6/adenine1519-N6)-dimethyltransferase